MHRSAVALIVHTLYIQLLHHMGGFHAVMVVKVARTKLFRAHLNFELNLHVDFVKP